MYKKWKQIDLILIFKYEIFILIAKYQVQEYIKDKQFFIYELYKFHI